MRFAAEQMLHGGLTPQQVERLALANSRLQEALFYV